jgi:hypothetical protein
MKSSTLILALWLGANALAQTPPLNQQANSPFAAKPGASQTKSSAASLPKPSTAVAPKNELRKNMKGTPANVPVKAANPAVKSARTTHRTKSFPYKTAAAPQDRSAIKGRRDPFVSPIVDRVRAASCSGSGKQCLVIGEISLHGVVHSPSGFIAVVMNGEHTYFLRENDPLADGSVERITRDAIVLRERSSDMFGRPITREVTRRLGVPPV